MTKTTQLDRVLSSWIGRLRLQRALLWFPRGLAFGLGVSLVVGGVGLYWERLLKSEFLALTILISSLAPILASLMAYLWRVDSIKAARHFDRIFHLDERVSTALELSASDRTDELIRKQLDDATRAARNAKPERGLPLRVQRVDVLISFIFIALLSLTWFRGERLFEEARKTRAVEQAVEEQQQKIEELIQEINTNENLTEEQKRELSKPLEEALQGLEENPSMEGSVATLASTEQKLQALSSDQSAQMSQALEEQGNQLAGQEGSPLESFGEQLANGNYAAAGNELTNMDLSQMSPQELQDLADQLEQMAQGLQSTNPQLAGQLQQAAQDIRNGDLQSAQQAMANAGQQLAQAGQQIAYSQAAQQAAGQMQQGAGQIIAAGGGQQQANASTQEQGQGQGQGQGQSQGTGQGGTNNGNSAGGSGSGHSDQSNASGGEAGSDPIEQSHASDGGELPYEQIYAPSLLGGAGGETVGLPSAGQDGDVVGTGPTTPAEDGQNLVPYTEVFAQYQQFNRQAIDNGEAPPQYLDIIRGYFGSIQP